jgi:hypothetical protein
MRPLAIALLISALAAPAHADSTAVWDVVANSVFPVLAALNGWPVECTGWYLGPVASKGGPAALYATAGHCPTPALVRTSSGVEATAVLGEVSEPGSDGMIALRADPRARRTFLRLAAAAPADGDPSIAIGWSGQHLTASRLVFAGTAANGLLQYRSSEALQPGMSGAPIVSLTTGEVTGIVVAGAEPRDNGASHVILATPASALRTLLGLVAHAPRGADGADALH